MSCKEWSREEMDELREDWRRNGDKEIQERLEVVAQLHACGTADVQRALFGTKKEKVFLADPAAAKKRKQRSYTQATKDEVIKACLLGGESNKGAAERFGVPYGTVNTWVAAARRRASEGPERSNSCPGKDKFSRGLEGLCDFIDAFQDTGLLEQGELEALDRVLALADGFCMGLRHEK